MNPELAQRIHEVLEKHHAWIKKGQGEVLYDMADVLTEQYEVTAAIGDEVVAFLTSLPLSDKIKALIQQEIGQNET